MKKYFERKKERKKEKGENIKKKKERKIKNLRNHKFLVLAACLGFMAYQPL